MPRSLDRHFSDDVVVAHVARLAVDANGAPQPPANSLTACRAEITLVIRRADSPAYRAAWSTHASGIPAVGAMAEKIGRLGVCSGRTEPTA
jgi:hypothetical protein